MISISRTLKQIFLESSLPFTQEQLKAFWAAMDERYFDHDEGCWQAGRDYGTCTYANQAPFQSLTKAGYKVEVWGADDKVFAGSYLDELGMVTGHDWGVVNDRWIVDVWAHAYLDPDLPVIYDMQDPKDKDIIAKVYPTRDKWTLVYSADRNDATDQHYDQWHKDSGADWDEFNKQST